MVDWHVYMHRPELYSLISRPLPDFILQLWKLSFSPQLQDKIWVGVAQGRGYLNCTSCEPRVHNNGTVFVVHWTWCHHMLLLAFDGWLEAVTCWCPHPPFGFLAVWPAGEAVYVTMFLMFILHHTRTEMWKRWGYYTSTLISYHASSLVPRPWGRRVTFFFPSYMLCGLGTNEATSPKIQFWQYTKTDG